MNTYFRNNNTMNFDTILNDLRHNTVTEFYLGAYVKIKFVTPLLPFEQDTRKLLTIIGWSSTDSAIVAYDNVLDANNLLVNNVFLLADVELAESLDKPIPTHCKFESRCMSVVGRNSSLLHCIYYLDGALTFDLISETIVTPLTESETVLLGYSSSSTSIPKNSSTVPLVSIEIVPDSDIDSLEVTDVMRFYAVLTPFTTTDIVVNWAVSTITGGTGNATLVVDTNTRIVDLAFTAAGTLILTATSDADDTILATLIVNVL